MPKKEYHEGFITDNQDPQKRGRVSVQCDTIVAGENLEWVEPTFHFVDSEKQAGIFFVPSIGSSITLEIEAEDGSEVTDLQPKWRCDVYPDGTIPEEFQENYPERRGWKTGAGHLLYFDDTDGSQTFLYRHPSGTELFIDNDGQIVLNPTGTQSIFLGEGATEHIPLGDLLVTLLSQMKTVFDAHGHPETGVVTGAPVTLPSPPGAAVMFPTVDDTILSDNHKVK